MNSFRVITDGVNTLQVVRPPIWWVTIFFGVVFLFSLLALIGSLKMRFLSKADGLVYLDGKVLATRSVGQSRSLPWIALAVVLGSGLFAWTTAQGARLTLNRVAGTWSLDSGFGLTGRMVETGQLGEIDHASLETDVGAVRFVVVLRGGARMSLGSYSDQGGQSEAVYAVNQFLKKANGAAGTDE